MGSTYRTSDGLESASVGDVGSLAPHASVAYRRGADAQEIERPLVRSKRRRVVGCDSLADVPLVQRAETLFGTYWCATERGHVIYESRLELARLMFADFDRRVKHIVAQPFLLRTKVAGE